MVAIGAAGLVARAEEHATAGVTYYADDDGLTVVHPAASAGATVGDGWRVQAGYEADVISGATVDVRTSASPRGFEETRHGANATVEHDLSRTVQLSGAYVLSHSPDYQSHGGSASVAVEDDERTRTVSLGVGAARDQVGRVGDAAPVGHLTTVGGKVGYATLLSAIAVLDVSLAGELRRGYQESPYRFVSITDAMGQSRVAVPEAVPEVRRRVAARARLRIAPTEWLFVRAWWRFHADDWGVAGHTVQTTWLAEPATGWLLSVHGRAYVQRGASFYQGTYASLPDLPALRTRDRTLAPSWFLAGGGRVRWTFGHWLDRAWHVDMRAEVTRYRYFDTPLLPQRMAYVLGGAVGMVR